MMAAEAKRIQSAIPEYAVRIALDEHGKDLSTEKFSQVVQGWQNNSQPIAILIGGPDGLDAELKASCSGLIRLSSMTMPHPLVRVVLIEQLYRAWSILANHPYHRI
jgi:23S rRNA (pseudouridine1915-N3)-methyltransferase